MAAPAPWKRFMPVAGNALADLGFGISQGGFKKGFGIAAQHGAAMAPSRAQQAEQLRKEQEAQQKQTETEAYLETAFPELYKKFKAGAPMEAVWNAAMKGDAEGFTLSPGQVRYDGAGKVLATGGEMPVDPKDQLAIDKEGFDRESALWKEYMAAEPVKTYQAVRNGYERVRSSFTKAQAAGDDAAGAGAADISMIYAYMKMLDPISAVREGEQATAANAGGIPAAITNVYNTLVRGDKLAPGVRQQFLSMADSLYQDASQNFQDINEQMNTRATGWDVDPSRVVMQPETYDPLGPPSVPGGGPVDDILKGYGL